MPVRVVLPDGQELTARLWARRETSRGWLYEVGLTAYRNTADGDVQAAEQRVRVRARKRVRAVGGVTYDAVPIERLPLPLPLPLPSAVREAPGPVGLGLGAG